MLYSTEKEKKKSVRMHTNVDTVRAKKEKEKRKRKKHDVTPSLVFHHKMTKSHQTWVTGRELRTSVCLSVVTVLYFLMLLVLTHKKIKLWSGYNSVFRKKNIVNIIVRIYLHACVTSKVSVKKKHELIFFWRYTFAEAMFTKTYCESRFVLRHGRPAFEIH